MGNLEENDSLIYKNLHTHMCGGRHVYTHMHGHPSVSTIISIGISILCVSLHKLVHHFQ